MTFILPATALVRGRFDIVHSQGLCGLRQNVVTVHMCQPAWFAAADRFAGRAGWRKRVFRAVVTRLDRLVVRPGGASLFIVPSNRVKEDLAIHSRLTDSVRVVQHGIDAEAFHPRNRLRWRDAVRAELGLAPADCAALYVGDLQKAMPAAMRALAQVPGVELVAVSRSASEPYSALAQEIGVADRIRFVPASPEIARYYAAADLFLFPTYYDTFGLVIAEAMASGLPVITSRAAGAGELVTHLQSGWLTPDAWDVDQIAEGLRTLAADAEIRDRMGVAARAAVEHRTWDRVADETMAVYREVLAGNRK